jgi:phenylacetate-coenzyme A ligase PaaK-like adenylate-forming protein
MLDKKIFNRSKALSQTDFLELAIETFRFQVDNVPVYQKFVKYLGVNVSSVNRLEQIPFMPISLFKTHKVLANDLTEELVFTSSGTTGMQTSKHYVAYVDWYQQSYRMGFELAFGSPKQYCILALLPSYLERGGSSLVYMVEDLIQSSHHPSSGFYLNQYDQLAQTIIQLEQQKQPTLLIGVSYALLDLIERHQFKLNYTKIIETGGMKGQRKELIKEEFYTNLKVGFGVYTIYSEYGMTELLSQAYSNADGMYNCPPWMQVLIRDVNDPFHYVPDSKSGGINIIDLANRYSCSFLATQDLGQINADGSFGVLGRFDHSDIRGCNLLVN